MLETLQSSKDGFITQLRDQKKKKPSQKKFLKRGCNGKEKKVEGETLSRKKEKKNLKKKIGQGLRGDTQET